jgi:hypothetical protein
VGSAQAAVEQPVSGEVPEMPVVVAVPVVPLHRTDRRVTDHVAVGVVEVLV